MSAGSEEVNGGAVATVVGGELGDVKLEMERIRQPKTEEKYSGDDHKGNFFVSGDVRV